MHYDVTRENGEIVNVMIWFGDGGGLNGCNNALLLYGGDLVLLKTEKVIPEHKWRMLLKDYQAWVQEFGTGYVSDLLRGGLAYRDKRLPKWIPDFELPTEQKEKGITSEAQS